MLKDFSAGNGTGQTANRAAKAVTPTEDHSENDLRVRPKQDVQHQQRSRVMSSPPPADNTDVAVVNVQPELQTKEVEDEEFAITEDELEPEVSKEKEKDIALADIKLEPEEKRKDDAGVRLADIKHELDKKRKDDAGVDLADIKLEPEQKRKDDAAVDLADIKLEIEVHTEQDAEAQARDLELEFPDEEEAKALAIELGLEFPDEEEAKAPAIELRLELPTEPDANAQANENQSTPTMAVSSGSSEALPSIRPANLREDAAPVPIAPGLAPRHEAHLAAPAAAGQAAPVNGPHTCLWNRCGRVFDDRMALEQHLNSYHLDKDILGPVSARFPKACLWDRCTRNRLFTKRYLLTSHMVTHHRNPRFQCPICHKGYTRFSSLVDHLRFDPDGGDHQQ